MSRILIVGNLADEKWIGNLINRVKLADPSIVIDCFWNTLTTNKPCGSSKYCRMMYKTTRHFPSILYQIPKIRLRIIAKDVTLSFQEFIRNRIKEGTQYDVVNYHYLGNETLSCWPQIYKIARITLLMPWGSDVLRRSNSYIKRMRKYVRHYDYVGTSDNPRFKQELIDKLAVKESQFINLDFGSESIDRLMDNVHVSREEAKEALGLAGKFIVTVGYNAHEEQHHIEVIEALARIKDRLPHNTMLVFPMTYGGKLQIERVRQKMEQEGFEYKIYDQYLSYQDIVYLRKCADMFVHAQTTDSNSASLAEYLFCRSTVINAAWLKYEHFEQFGMPYYTFSDFSELSKILEKAIKGGSLVNDNLVHYIEQYSWTYKTPKWVALFTGNNTSNQ